MPGASEGVPFSRASTAPRPAAPCSDPPARRTKTRAFIRTGRSRAVIVDLTLTISSALPSFPGSPAPGCVSWSSLERDGYNLELLFMSSHSGTHMDAPFHFARGGRTVERIPVGRLVGDALLIRIPKGRGGAITKSEIVSYERRGGEIPRKSTVIFYTGWQKNLSRPDYFLRNPGLSRGAAAYLASKETNLVGTDSPSIDPGRGRGFAAHRVLAGNDVLIVENLANLERIRRSKFHLTVLPLKLRGASGSPVRALGAT